MLILGVCQFYDFICPERPPPVNYLGKCQERCLARYNSTKSVDVNTLTDKELWIFLQTPLMILDRACPQASKWVRDRYEKGKIVFTTCDCDTYARYDYISETLYIDPSFWSRQDGEKAVTLAHEYRHSIQNFTQRVRAFVYYIIFQDVREEIIENDAYDFERQVYIAIYL
jgi:hypothetical protein